MCVCVYVCVSVCVCVCVCVCACVCARASTSVLVFPSVLIHGSWYLSHRPTSDEPMDEQTSPTIDKGKCDLHF